MKIRFYVSLIISKLLYTFLKITKLSSGTAIIGLITLKICPDFLSHINKFITKAKINITGTNGKTTTSGIISHLIKCDGKTLIHNAVGANMLNGIVNTLAVETNPFKRYDYSIIETDEAFVKKVYAKMDGDYLLVTNLFEDQTDRFANPIFTRNIIQDGINLNPNVQLILNADDPISSSLKSNKTSIYYSIESVIDNTDSTSNNAIKEFYCPLCNSKLNYAKNYYEQIGFYSCNCGYNHPEAKYKATVTLHKDHSCINLNNEYYEIPLTGLFNAYNALGAIVLAKELEIQSIQHNIKSFKVAFGRSEKRILNGHSTIIQLIKNPAGTNEVLKTIDLNSDILIAINNNTADGTDISWINQVNFEKLATTKKEIVVTGLKAKDMAERLQKAGVNDIQIITDIDKAVKYLSKNAKNNITILTTYTALLKIDKIKEIKKCY